VHAAPLLGTRQTPPSRAGHAPRDAERTETGGEGGIRTPGNLVGCTRFPSELLKPLGHLSTHRLLAGVWRLGVRSERLFYRSRPDARNRRLAAPRTGAGFRRRARCPMLAPMTAQKPEPYQVVARRFRPQAFAEVVGQES